MRKSIKNLASMSMISAMLVPTAFTATASANSVKNNQHSSIDQKQATTINTVSEVRAAMQAEGLNLNNIHGKYVVRQGDTLLAISEAANESMTKIATINHLTNLNTIYVGQVLYLDSNVETPLENATNNGISSLNQSTETNTMNNSVVTPASFTGSGTVAAQPSRTAEQARNAAQVATKAPVASTTTAKAADTKKASSAVKSSTTSLTKTTSSSTKASSAVSSSKATTASKSSVVSSSTANKPAQSSSSTASQASTKPAASTSSSSQASSSKVTTPAKTSSAPSKAPVSSVNNSKPVATQSSQTNPSTTAPVSSKAPIASNSSSKATTPAATTPSQTPTSNSSSSTNYDNGVVNSDGTVNYQAAMNQKGSWNNQNQSTDDFGRSQAEQTWLKNHPNAKMTGETYADGNTTEQVPVYSNAKNDPYENADRPQMTAQQLQDTNTAMQKNINASQTFGNGIQWVSSNYQGEQTGTQSVKVDNPVQTPYQSYTGQAGQVDANVVKQAYTGGTISGQKATVPAGSHYVSSNITNAGQTGGSDGLSANQVNLTFYK